MSYTDSLIIVYCCLSVLLHDYKYSKPIEHYAIFTAYFYLSFRFIHCFVAGRSTGL